MTIFGQNGTNADMTTSAPLVCVLVYDGLCTFEYGIGAEVFGLSRPEFDAWYQFKTIAIEDGPIRAQGNIQIVAEHDLQAIQGASLILVPGWRGYDTPVPDALITALQTAHAKGARIASICSGVFVLAAAGLLEGRRATTHWRYVDALQEMYPNTQVDGDVLYIDEGQVLTSAGSAAGLDLCLHIVRKDWGVTHANAVARRLVLPTQRDGGQRQFVTAPVPSVRGTRLAPLLDHIRQHLDEDWPVTRMAEEAGMTSRTLTRRFRSTTGESPLSWLTKARVSHAAELLEASPSSLSDIAQSCGFGSDESFRREFRKNRGIAPSKYRASFGKIAG